MRVEALILLFPANIPTSLKKPAEVGWQDDQWGDYESPTLAEVFRKLEREGLPSPLQLCGVQGGARSGYGRLLTARKPSSVSHHCLASVTTVTIAIATGTAGDLVDKSVGGNIDRRRNNPEFDFRGFVRHGLW